MSKKFDIIIKKKDFDVNQPLNIPKIITNYQINNTHLYIAPEKASYFSTNSIGNQIFESFRKGQTIRDVILHMRSNLYSENTINAEISNLLIKLEKNGFYEDANVTDLNEDEQGLQLYITNKCNLNCCHCYMDAGKKRNNELTISEWGKILDDFSKITKGKITFTGGEPLLYPGIISLFEKAKKNGSIVELFTNGTLINEKNVRNIVDFMDMVQISLDGASPKVNDGIRGKGVWEKIVRAIKLINKSNPQVKIVIAITLMPSNFRDIEDNIDEFIKLFEFDFRIKLGLATTFGRANSNVEFPDPLIAEKAMTNILGGLYSKRLKGMRKITRNVRIRNCGYGEIITILSNGEVFPCALPLHGIGNIRDISLLQAREIFLKNRIASDINNLDICSSCDVRYFCVGGCRLNYITKNNSISKSYCTEKMKKEMLEKLIMRDQFDGIQYWMMGNEK